MRNPSPYHNRPSPISIPLENASVGKPFPTTSVQTTSPVSTKSVNRDSSVKKTGLHCLIGKRLGACAVTQAIWRARRARLSGKPTLGWLVDQTRATDSLWFPDKYGDYDCLPYLPQFLWPWGDDYADGQNEWLCLGAATSRADVQIGVSLQPVQFPSDVAQDVLWWKHAHRNA